ncbi:MAG TPA: DUF4384 domain-containing protein [Blastocatellia bacterium]|nr:DUF4384 domain-containing protein [Blastocatellia bacterium]
MKREIRFTAALLVVCGLLATAAAAQSRQRPQERGIQLKEDYEAGKVDGMRVLILKSEGGNFVPVDPARVFKPGDEIRVAFESNFDGYVYVINVSPAGAKRVIFPGAQASNSSNVIRARQRVELPSTSFIFDKETGTEILQVIMSREPIAVLDAAVRESQGQLQSASSAAAELSASPQRGIISGDASLPQGAQLKARGIFLAEGKDKDKAGSVVAIADEKRSDGRLKPGEVASFEIRLQHN